MFVSVNLAPLNAMAHDKLFENLGALLQQGSRLHEVQRLEIGSDLVQEFQLFGADEIASGYTIMKMILTTLPVGQLNINSINWHQRWISVLDLLRLRLIGTD